MYNINYADRSVWKNASTLEYKDIELLGIKNDDWNKVINYMRLIIRKYETVNWKRKYFIRNHL